jgi:hypothetical protein
MAKSQSTHHSLSPFSFTAKLQSSSRHNYRKKDSSNPHSPGLDNWQSNRLRSNTWHDKPSNNSSNPHSPGLGHWQSNGSIQESKKSDSGVSSSSSIYYLETDDGQTEGSQGSGSSGMQRRIDSSELGFLLDKDGEELAPSIPQKAAAWRPVVRSPQQCDGGAPGKHASQVDLDPSSLVPIPTLPPHLLTSISNLF